MISRARFLANISNVISLKYISSKIFSGFSFLFFSITIYFFGGAESLGALSLGALGYGALILPLIAVIETYQYHRQDNYYSLSKIKDVIFLFLSITLIFAVVIIENIDHYRDFAAFLFLGLVINMWVFGLKLLDLLEFYKISTSLLFLKSLVEYLCLIGFYLNSLGLESVVFTFIAGNFLFSGVGIAVSLVSSLRAKGPDFSIFKDEYFIPLLIQKILVFIFLNIPGGFLLVVDGIGALGTFDLIQRLFKRYSSLLSNILISFKTPIFRYMSSHPRRDNVERRISVVAMGLRVFVVFIFSSMIWLFLDVGDFLIISFSIAFIIEGYTQMRFFFHSNRPSLWLNVSLTGTRMVLTVITCWLTFVLGIFTESFELVGAFICCTALLKVIEVFILGRIGSVRPFENKSFASNMSGKR